MRATAGLGSETERDCLRSLMSKQLVPLVLLITFAWLIVTKASSLDFNGIFAAVHAIAPQQWGAAVFAACVSFWAIGRMDAVVHRLMGTGTPDHIAQLSGIASVATAQLTGFGLLTGTLARWRVLPDISLWRAAQITGAVSASFMLALGVISALMVLITGPGIPFDRVLALAGLVFVASLIAGSLWRPRRLMRFKLPPLKAQISLLGLALLDTGAAALTLYVLIPEASLPPPALFYTIFLLALGAGLLGTTPGGVGPFEMMFLLLLPELPQAPMLAAILGYRLVYFALPALLAAGLLIAGPSLARALPAAGCATPRLRPASTAPQQPMALGALSFNARRAEAGLMRQGEFDLLCDARDRPLSLVVPAGQSLIMLSDPLCAAQCPRDAVETLHAAAGRRFLTPCLYKCGARTAAMARRAGWSVVQIAQEAHIAPAKFDLAGPACRQLRRQIRKARRAGVKVGSADAQLPIADMRRLAQGWATRRGGARGFSMGRFCAEYVGGQRVYLAHLDGALIGFVSFHEAWCERTLDLMCHSRAAPTGTMHLLIASAIEAAARDDCARLSLAAVPRLSDCLPLPAALATRIDTMTGAAGLIRFKASFAPRWEPLYLAAPGPLALALAGLDLADRITRPRAEPEPA